MVLISEHSFRYGNRLATVDSGVKRGNARAKRARTIEHQRDCPGAWLRSVAGRQAAALDRGDDLAVAGGCPWAGLSGGSTPARQTNTCSVIHVILKACRIRRAAALQEPENMSDQPPVRLDVDADGIDALTLNRPEQLNAFDLNMIETWRAARGGRDLHRHRPDRRRCRLVVPPAPDSGAPFTRARPWRRVRIWAWCLRT